MAEVEAEQAEGWYTHEQVAALRVVADHILAGRPIEWPPEDGANHLDVVSRRVIITVLGVAHPPSLVRMGRLRAALSRLAAHWGL